MAKKPRKQLQQTITLLRGGFGHVETGVIMATTVTAHVVGKQTVSLTRHTVQMNNATGPFGASVRFVFGQSQVVSTGKAAA